VRDFFNSKSWKTTSAGLTSFIGSSVCLFFLIKNHTATQETVTASLIGMATGLGLIFARDNNKSSEDIGINDKK